MPRRPGSAAAVFTLTALGSFMAALDLSIVNVAFPDLSRSFAEASAASLSWVLTAYSIVFGSLLVAAGRTADRSGRKRTYQTGLATFLLGSLLCGLAPNVAVLVASRVLQGVGASLLVPSSVALLIAAFPPERRTHIVALWGGIGALAVATGPSLGAAIVSAGGWRWAFFVNLPVGLVALVVGSRVLVESVPERGAGTPDYAGVLLLSAPLAALVLAISQGSDWGWGDERIVASAVFAVVGLALFVRRSRRHPEPLVDPALFRDRTFVAANAATLLYATGFFAMLLGNILFLTGVWHYSIMRAGLGVTPGPLVVAAIAGSAGKLASRIGFRPVLLAGGTCFAGGLLWYVARVDATPAYLAHWLPGMLVVGLGIGLTFPVLSAAAVSSLPPARFGVGSAVNQTARQIGGAIGIAVLVLLLDGGGIDAFHHLWAYCAAMALVSGGVGALIPNPNRRARRTVEAVEAELLAPEIGLPLPAEAV